MEYFVIMSNNTLVLCSMLLWYYAQCYFGILPLRIGGPGKQERRRRSQVDCLGYFARGFGDQLWRAGGFAYDHPNNENFLVRLFLTTIVAPAGLLA
jgi:hypothetical protein